MSKNMLLPATIVGQPRPPRGISITLAAVVCAAMAPAGPALALPMGGNYTGHVDRQIPHPLGPNEVRIEQTASGLNTGPGTPLDGAKVQWVETATLRNGQGPVQGITTPSGATSSAYKGTATTDPQGRVTVRGTYRVTNGTGDLAGVKGSGNFSAAYTSRADFTGEWRGEALMPGQKSSKR
jgi:hypothetical protein